MGTARTVMLAVATALVAGLALPAIAEQAGQYTFTILRDGNPIGKHRFAFEASGERLQIEESTDLEVKFAMIPVFEFANHTLEVWENGSPISITSKTNDDGEEFDITVQPNGHGLIRTVNGRVDHFDPEYKVLGFWDKDVVNHSSFFSVVEDKVIEASFELVGKEIVEVDGVRLATEHYRMVGDIERDIWFDEAGHAVKVEFEKGGSQIAYLRNEAIPQALECASASDTLAAKLC
jgi:hypothetical protein